VYFTGISNENIFYDDDMAITPSPGIPDQSVADSLSHPPTPQALHDVLAPLETEQSTEPDPTGSFSGDHEDD
jgi:hypothetical protein